MINFDVINDIPTTNKTVFLLTDLNVPIDDRGIITNDEKIRLAMPTIRYLVKTGARVVIATHLGHPAKQFDARFSTRPIAKYLNDRLPCDVVFCDECVGEKSRREIFRTEYGDVVVLENLLFHREESECDMNFARSLADGMNIYVNDAFGYCDKAFASVLGVPLFVRATGGLVLANEIRKLEMFLHNSKWFTTAMVGGNSFGDSYVLLNSLAENVKCLIVGREIANTMLVASGKKVGKSVYEPAMLEKAQKLLSTAAKNDCLILLPKDVLVVKTLTSLEHCAYKSVNDLDKDDIIIDVGNSYLRDVYDVLGLSQCVLWSGLLGTSIAKKYCPSAKWIAEKLAFLTSKKKLFSIVGSQDVFALVKQLGLLDKVSFASRNYHSVNQYLSGNVLPGVEILRRLSKQLA